MTYPILQTAEAVDWLDRRRQQALEDEPLAAPDTTMMNDEGDAVLFEALGDEMAEHEIEELEKCRRYKTGMATYERNAAPRIHALVKRTLGADHPAIGDNRFWNWLSVVKCYELVRLRYGGAAGTKAVANGNVASQNASDVFLYRLWLRAEMSVREIDGADDYTLTECGDIDFWRSHVLRQRYAEVPTFTRALVRFQYPDATQAPKLGGGQIKIRTLAKELRSSCANTSIELLDEEQSLAFIESRWKRAEPRAEAALVEAYRDKIRKEREAS